MKTILIVDDAPEGRDMYAQALAHEGYRVIEAADGAEAVRRAVEDPPDLVLMNISIPLVNGIDATEILKALPATEDVPILMVTGHTSPTIQDDAWTAGCDQYLAKPVLPTEIVAAVAEYLGPGPSGM